MNRIMSSPKWFRTILALLLILSAPAFAATPYLVKDIDPTYDQTGNSSPESFVTFGSATYFAADIYNGDELCKTDGTEAGTRQVKGGLGEGVWYVDDLTRCNDTLYFFGRDQLHTGLWKSDGTSEGTVLVKDMSGLYQKNFLTPCGDKVFFSCEDSTHGVELWVSDGTSEGTHIVADINPAGDSNPFYFCDLNSKLIFTAYDEAHGYELWVSDGTEAGTYLLCDTYPGPVSGDPTDIKAIGGIAYFSGYSGVWKTDGTISGTVLVKDGFGDVHDFVSFGGKIFFSGDTGLDCELWVTDGTSAGTTLFKDLEPSEFSHPTGKIVIGSTLYFVTVAATNGVKIWKCDGTPAGTVALGQIYTSASEYYNFQFIMRGVNNRLVVFASSPSNDCRMWTSDGTPAGTVEIPGYNRDPYASAPVADQPVNSVLAYASWNEEHGSEPWVTDGTPAGTHLLKEFRQVPNGLYAGMSMLAALGRVFIPYHDSFTRMQELWVSDGTEAGTFKLTDANSGTNGVYVMAEYMNKVYFIADDGVHGTEIWRTDGTRAGTSLLMDLEPGAGGSEISWFFVAGNKLYFQATTTGQGTGLWVYDGAAFTFLGALNVRYSIFDWNGSLGFVADPGNGVFGLYKSDGTAVGTRLITNKQAVCPCPVGNKLYFAVNGYTVNTLYVTDLQTTTTLATFPASMYYARSIEAIKAANGTVLVQYYGQLWKTDGTPASTMQITTTPSFSSVKLWRNYFDKMYFTATSTANGNELWRTDGTSAGTEIFNDVYVGSPSSSPTSLLPYNNLLYFVATDAEHGGEIWSTDGIAGHTQVVGEIFPGPTSSSPQKLAAAGRNLFFQADDKVHGLEVWAIPLDDRSAETVSIATGNTSVIASSIAGMNVDFDANTTAGQITMARYNAMPPGRTNDLTGYWVVSGLPHSTFSVILTFNYDPATVTAAGFTEANLRLIRSIDGGRTWVEIPSVVNTTAHTIRTASAQSRLGMYAITSADRIPSMEIWVNFLWNGFEAGTISEPYNTILEGIMTVDSGGKVKVNSGSTLEHPRITRPMRIEAVGGTVRVGAN